MTRFPTPPLTRLAAVLVAGLALTACGPASDPATEETDGGHAHGAEGGELPEGMTEQSDPTFAIGSDVTLTADHMEGMDGSPATIVGAYDTTAYSVDYVPTTGGPEVTDHRWVVQEELEDPATEPLADGTPITIDAAHMEGMDGAEGTVHSSTEETVYVVDIEMDGMTMTDHLWVVESEIEPA